MLKALKRAKGSRDVQRCLGFLDRSQIDPCAALRSNESKASNERSCGASGPGVEALVFLRQRTALVLGESSGDFLFEVVWFCSFLAGCKK